MVRSRFAPERSALADLRSHCATQRRLAAVAPGLKISAFCFDVVICSDEEHYPVRLFCATMAVSNDAVDVSPTQ